MARIDDDSTVRRVAVNALGRRVDAAEVRELMEHLARTDHVRHVRNAARRALICLPDFGPDDLPDLAGGETIP